MFVVISRWNLRRMRTVLDKSYRKNENTFYVFVSENQAIYEIMWKNIVEQDRPRIIWITKTRIRTHSRYFHCNNGYTNAPQCYLIPTIPLFLLILYDVRFPTGLLHCTARFHCFVWS